MARPPPEIKVDVTWETTDDPNAILPWVRATEILLKAKARRDARLAVERDTGMSQSLENQEVVGNPGMNASNTALQPFASYPEGGRALLGKVKGANCRHEYGLQFMRKTGQTCCAFCGLDFAASYQNWLQMALDHVVPTRTGTEKCIPAEWLDDSSNKVLACAACNGFRNRYKLSDVEVCPTTLDGFYDLRDRVFAERKTLVMESHQREQTFFDGKPWAI